MSASTAPGTTPATTARVSIRPQTLREAYDPPANVLEVDVINPETHKVGNKRFTDYEVRLRTNLPVFKIKESSVRRRFSDFEWLRNELEKGSKIVVPLLPSKAWKLQLPFRNDDGIFEDEFIEERRKGLEQFINKVACHPLAQNEKCLHMFLLDAVIDRNYTPGKVYHQEGELKIEIEKVRSKMSFSSQKLSDDNLEQNGKSSPVLIEVSEPQNHGVGNKKYTDYLVKTKTTLPIFAAKEFSVRRRFSDFEFLKTKLEQKLKIKTPPLPEKAWTRQIPFMKETIFDDAFVEERRKSLDHFINQVSEHPLVQTDKLWVSFLQDDEFQKK